MVKNVLIPIPSCDFDPTEAAVPWQILTEAGVKVTFATPQGLEAQGDQRIVTGKGLGLLAPLLAADQRGKQAYRQMTASPEFKKPEKWDDISASHFDGIILPGGHAPGMREYLDSVVLQKLVSKFFEKEAPIGAICHGVVLASRSKTSDGAKSVLWGRKTTSLLASQELTAWGLTCLWLGSYYRTYKTTVESEVKASLESPSDFFRGPLPLLRDTNQNLNRGFVVVDGNYVSARWPGDAHHFAHEFLKL